MDATALYLGYCELGRETFLQRAEPALVFRGLGDAADAEAGAGARAASLYLLTHASAGLRADDGETVAVLPLKKKPDTPFARMITVGRTGNNDVCVPDPSVSRFHVYFRDTDRGWLVCDAGSRNGTRVEGRTLTARVETPIASGATLQIGDVAATFCAPPELYALLSQLSFTEP